MVPASLVPIGPGRPCLYSSGWHQLEECRTRPHKVDMAFFPDLCNFSGRRQLICLWLVAVVVTQGLAGGTGGTNLFLRVLGSKLGPGSCAPCSSKLCFLFVRPRQAPAAYIFIPCLCGPGAAKLCSLRVPPWRQQRGSFRAVSATNLCPSLARPRPPAALNFGPCSCGPLRH